MSTRLRDPSVTPLTDALCRVFVVDRADLDRELLVQCLERAEGFGLAGAERTLVGGRGLDEVDALVVRASAPGTDLVVEVAAARRAGCTGIIVVVASVVDDHLIDAVRVAGASAVMSTAAPLSRLLDALLGFAPTAVEDAGVHDLTARHGLTPREVEVLHHLADGVPPQQIARLVGARLPTVRDHVRSLRQKLGCATATEVVVVAHRLGLAPHVGRPVR